MDEHGYIRSVHDKLITEVKRVKFNTRYGVAGLPDCWYGGWNSREIWIEYKYFKSLPKRDTTEIMIKHKSWLAQRDWLDDLVRRKIDCALIIGSPEGAVIELDGQWHKGRYRTDFLQQAYTAREVAGWITARVLQ
jgi:hypothetical protein